MILDEWLKKYKMNSLKFNAKFLQVEFIPQESDKNASWELYVELITRVATQRLEPNHGDEKTALDSIYSLFSLTREVMKNNKGCTRFAKIAIIVLNQIIRPFTAKWHKLSIDGVFENKKKCVEFRKELSELQIILRDYSKMLAEIAEVEDLTEV